MLYRTPQELLPFVLGDIGRFLDANVPNREKMEQDRFTEVTIMTRACEIYLEASISSTHNAPFLHFNKTLPRFNHFQDEHRDD